MLQLEKKWVWDFWFAVDGDDYHIFYLQADKALGDPNLRHWNVSVGHAVSQDLKNWHILPDAIAPTSNNDDAPDSFTTWTGCVFNNDGSWIMFYTGTKRAEKGLVQRVCAARSLDLITWVKSNDNPIVELDERWYDGLKLEYWHDASWRDPWVMKDPQTHIYHMLVTCRVNSGEPDGRGAIGYASSQNLENWTVAAPFLAPGWYGEMEVPQIEKIGEYYYLFCSVSARFHSRLHNDTQNVAPQTGVKYFIADNMLGPYRCIGNGFLTGPQHAHLYSGRVIRDPNGDWQFLAFLNIDAQGDFLGEIIDPIRVIQLSDGRLQLMD